MEINVQEMIYDKLKENSRQTEGEPVDICRLCNDNNIHIYVTDLSETFTVVMRKMKVNASKIVAIVAKNPDADEYCLGVSNSLDYVSQRAVVGYMVAKIIINMKMKQESLMEVAHWDDVLYVKDKYAKFAFKFLTDDEVIKPVIDDENIKKAGPPTIAAIASRCKLPPEFVRNGIRRLGE